MTPLTVQDLRRLARRRVPRVFYDYGDAGSWNESTYHANESDFQFLKLRQRVGIDISERSLATTLLGNAAVMPVALAPIGMIGMQHADGEMLAARAAAQFGVPFTLSTMSICSIEDVARHTGKPFWFQLYVTRDRGFMHSLIDRAEAAGCNALVVTMDTQVLGQRHKDLRNGLARGLRFAPRAWWQMARHPRWCWRMLRTPRRQFGNIIGHAAGVRDLHSFMAWTATQFDQSLSWADLPAIRARWGGKLVVKGILDPEDARLAAGCGADAIVVSNHGGRQLDGAPSTIASLPAIVDAVAGQTEIHLDGGIRSGQDVMKALALGARGIWIGRAYLYGLAALGQPGVTLALEIIRKELDLTMAFCGERRVTDVGRHNLARPPSATAPTPAQAHAGCSANSSCSHTHLPG